MVKFLSARSLTLQKHTMRELDLQMLATLEESVRRDHQQKLLNLCKPEKCSSSIIATERLQPSCANLCCSDPTEWDKAMEYAALHLYGVRSASTGKYASEFQELEAAPQDPSKNWGRDEVAEAHFLSKFRAECDDDQDGDDKETLPECSIHSQLRLGSKEEEVFQYSFDNMLRTARRRERFQQDQLASPKTYPDVLLNYDETKCVTRPFPCTQHTS